MRIAGTNIPDQKQIPYALAYIKGIGIPLAQRFIAAANIEPRKLTKDLTPDEVNRLRDLIEKNVKVEGELRREVMMNIKRLKDIGTYRGFRHIRGLPVRGQRTKTNSRTRRGNVRKTIGSGRKPAASPT